MFNIYKKILLLIMPLFLMPILSGCNIQTTKINKENNTTTTQQISNKSPEDTVAEKIIDDDDRVTKEFSMTSFTEIIDGKYYPQFSTKEIEVNKGDIVKIKITATSGTHNFNIDEFDLHYNTPLDKEIVIEFKADQAGEFIYYCSIPGHRANGHWGKLIVLE